MTVRVKICGLTSVEDARAAVRAGADAIGLNFVQSSPRCVTEAVAVDIRLALPPFVHVVGVFADAPMERVHRLATRLELDYVQLHGLEAADSLWHYKCPVLKAFRVTSEDSLLFLPAWEDVAAAILLDGAGKPEAHGGVKFDWSLARAARAATALPIVIAGGLNPENVAGAIQATEAFAVDVASGVEREPGRKDEELMRMFVAAAKGTRREERTP
jgi:phosphoribosylanthranilate isomerase